MLHCVLKGNTICTISITNFSFEERRETSSKTFQVRRQKKYTDPWTRHVKTAGMIISYAPREYSSPSMFGRRQDIRLWRSVKLWYRKKLSVSNYQLILQKEQFIRNKFLSLLLWVFYLFNGKFQEYVQVTFEYVQVTFEYVIMI